jgi:hypothetical protein
MADLLYVLATLILFGVAHGYTEACERLKARPTHD